MGVYLHWGHLAGSFGDAHSIHSKDVNSLHCSQKSSAYSFDPAPQQTLT